MIDKKLKELIETFNEENKEALRKLSNDYIARTNNTEAKIIFSNDLLTIFRNYMFCKSVLLHHQHLSSQEIKTKINNLIEYTNKYKKIEEALFELESSDIFIGNGYLKRAVREPIAEGDLADDIIFFVSFVFSIM